jgi:hypothetical protein
VRKRLAWSDKRKAITNQRKNEQRSTKNEPTNNEPTNHEQRTNEQRNTNNETRKTVSDSEQPKTLSPTPIFSHHSSKVPFIPHCIYDHY